MNQCLRFLQLHNIFCWRNNTGATKIGSRFIRFGYAGSSDILGILPNGKFLAVECKREKGGRLSEKQKIFLDTINKNGGFAICVNSLLELEKRFSEINIFD